MQTSSPEIQSGQCSNPPQKLYPVGLSDLLHLTRFSYTLECLGLKQPT